MRERSEMKNTGKRTGRKIIKIILGIIGGILLSCAVVFAIYKLAIDPHRGVNHSAVESLPLDEMITTAQAVEDIDYVMKMFRDRHPAWLEEGNTRVADVENCYIEEIGEQVTLQRALRCHCNHLIIYILPPWILFVLFLLVIYVVSNCFKYFIAFLT